MAPSRVGGEGERAAPGSASPHLPVLEFTRRQREVMAGLMAGRAPRQVAIALGLEVRTVYWHVENVYERVRVHSLGAYLAWAHAHHECCRLDLMVRAARRLRPADPGR
ncbi:MAG: hypothetical protein FJZ92_08025 [Chloroflexi bacterium]|nr:hypothetical protein [Chloroflexota bacterium]